jgi:hypothetical protein
MSSSDIPDRCPRQGSNLRHAVNVVEYAVANRQSGGTDLRLQEGVIVSHRESLGVDHGVGMIGRRPQAGRLSTLVAWDSGLGPCRWRRPRVVRVRSDWREGRVVHARLGRGQSVASSTVIEQLDPELENLGPPACGLVWSVSWPGRRRRMGSSDGRRCLSDGRRRFPR